MNYAAAGILPVCLRSHKILLGSEPSFKYGSKKMIWGAFGGRREPQDQNDPRCTAWREFHEETGNAFYNTFTRRAFDQSILCSFYCSESKFYLYVVSFAYTPFLPWFTDEDGKRDKTINKRDLMWFPLEYFLHWIQFPNDFTLYFGFLSGGKEMLTPFFVKILQRNFLSFRKFFFY